MLAASLLGTAACGSSDDRDNPERPIVDVAVDSQLVDVGERYRLDASGSFDPENDGLTYFWTLIPPPESETVVDDRCADDPEQICTENFDACSTNANLVCTTNADCPDEGQCIEDLSPTSPQCTTGRCGIGDGREGEFITFVADAPGPYTVRVTVESSQANDTAQVEVDTYPSLYVLGSLFAFGGTEGGLVAELADAETFAAGAVAIATDPQTGNLLLAIPGPPGRVREFDSRDGSDLGRFGETTDFVTAPVALAFDESDRLYIADADGAVNVFDAGSGRFVRALGDVTAGTEEVASIEVSPATGELLVVDGRAGQGIRRYDPATGASLGVLGAVESVATRPADVAFVGDPPAALFVADAAGELVRCAPDGTACAVVAAASALLQPDGPTSLAVNPAAGVTDADVVVADAVAGAVVACTDTGSACGVFGQTAGLDSDYLDVTFAPAALPELEPPPMFTTTTTTDTVP